MLDRHTETIAMKLKELLVTMAKKELRAEKEKQTLAKVKGFEPISAFKYICEGGQSINHQHLHRVFQEHFRGYISEDDCKYLIFYYGTKTNRELDLTDFNNLAFCNENMGLRAKASQRPIKMQVSTKTKQAISDMLEKELDYHIQTERVKRELECCVNFSTLLAFRILDVKNYNYVDFEGIRVFLERMGFKAK